MKLTPSQWQTLSTLLGEALDLPQAKRSQWLAAKQDLAPEIDATLRRLLAQTSEAETVEFLNTLPKLTGDPSRAPAPGLSPGETVGAYRLLRELGRGGMGAVWLAERIDGQLKRPVALKLPHLSVDSAVLSERFARERDILAALSHPNIARLYDAGLTDVGQPFLALEYIEGRTLLEDCAARGLNLRQRLDLFEQVLAAVRYAHAHLVIHRDLKPSNILVTPDGQVKLLDFGVAKLVAEGESPVTQLTLLGGHAMTPDYASPEQILGQPINTSSDVYSLGVLLFELLCGERPYRVRRKSLGALEDAVLRSEPPAPSTLARDRSLARQLRGDLDTIVLKALKKLPVQRYESVAAMSEDLRRHAASLPVLAQPDTRWYRWNRFLTRNWIPVSAIAGVFVALIAGTAIALWQAHTAQQAQLRADQVKRFIASIFTDTRPAQGKGGVASAAELLMRASQRVPAELAANPRVGAELDTIIADALGKVGELDQSRMHLEQALARDRAALGDRDRTVLLLKIRLANAYMVQGKSAAAEPLLLEAAAALRGIGRAGAADLVMALRYLANVQYEHGGEQGLDSAREGVEVADRWLGADDPDRLPAMSTLVNLLRLSSRTAEALTVARRAQTLAERLFGSQRPNELLAAAELDLASVLSPSDQPAEGAALARRALADISALQSGESDDVAWAVIVLAQALRRSGELNEAIQQYQRAIRILAAERPGASTDLATLIQGLGESLLESRRPEEAMARMRAADQMTTEAGGDLAAWWTRERRLDRAEALLYLGRLGEAGALIDGPSERAAAAADGADPTHQWAHAAQLRAVESRLNGQARSAIDTANASLRQAAEHSPGPRNEAALRVVLAQALLDDGRAQAARPLLEQALKQYEAAQVLPSPRLADALVGMGRAELALGNANTALASLKRAHEFWQHFDSANVWAAEAQHWYGRALLGSGQAALGRRQLAQARPLLARAPLAALRSLAAVESKLTRRTRPRPQIIQCRVRGPNCVLFV